MFDSDTVTLVCTQVGIPLDDPQEHDLFSHEHVDGPHPIDCEGSYPQGCQVIGPARVLILNNFAELLDALKNRCAGVGGVLGNAVQVSSGRFTTIQEEVPEVADGSGCSRQQLSLLELLGDCLRVAR